ncbi:WD domain, G-beta repeat containing protein [Babesia divergens]|uniref:WD domain, G-beta repeat containing protein n=1 Tax=Babesia divergens TaxID=32595 RepID=A0AAD9GH75_BABDI|nr:WD domain, G-beta repeat containing protein [Babesia divergens]
MTADENDSTWNGFQKSQLLRIVMQLLLDMGYSETVDTLQKESGCIYQCPRITRLEEVIRSGNMKEARCHLSQLKIPSDIRMACVFLCSQQSFAAALHRNDTKRALEILRDDLSPSAFDEDTQRRVQLCASLLGYPSVEHALKTELHWEAESSLRNLWTYIQHLISPKLCLPPNRLLALLHQALELQELYCTNHCDPGTPGAVPSLYEDHHCEGANVPARCIARIDGHVDEVWDIALSPNEKYLATAGMDKCILLWHATSPFDRIHTWEGHASTVIAVNWSYDSTLCASLSSAGCILLWTPGQSTPLARIETDVVTHMFLQWIPGRWSLLTGADVQLILYDVHKLDLDANTPTTDCQAEGEASDHPQYRIKVANTLSVELRIRSLTVNKDGTIALFSTPDCMLHVMDLRNFTELPPIKESAAITMLTCSSLHNQVLVSVAGQHPSLRLWDLDERRLIQTYHGHREERYILKSAMGGPGECYVVSGSEDSQIYIWNKLLGTLISVIGAHSSTVNAVAWSTTPNAPLFSASDDGQIAVWEPLPSDNSDEGDMNY